MNDYGIESYSAGDIVSCQFGNTDSVITGKLNGCDDFYVGASKRTVRYLLMDGWTVTTLKKAAPKVVVPRAIVQFAGGQIASWHDDIFGWLVTGGTNAYGTSDALIFSFGSKFTILEAVAK